MEVKSTLAGLAEALNALLANGVDPDAVVEMWVGVDGQRVLIRFAGFVDVETIGADSRSTPGRKLRVILLTSEHPE
jgi:3-hydroxyisobutyrate dehydrogenase-like beta-hydroxyacid dehydrogenase